MTIRGSEASLNNVVNKGKTFEEDIDKSYRVIISDTRRLCYSREDF